jgi:hypothetical protein
MKLNETRDVRAGWKALLAAFAVAALLPVAAFAEDVSPSDKLNGSRACQALKTSLGPATFASTYGTNADKSNAFGKCVSQWTQAEHKNRVEAIAACKAEQADAGFAAAHGGKSFDQFYGSGKNGGGAFNQCVKSKRADASAEDQDKVENAARKCKAERKTLGAEPFKAKYGGSANAFGKCVSKLARA